MWLDFDQMLQHYLSDQKGNSWSVNDRLFVGLGNFLKVVSILEKR
jgi:hypothetical protein